MGKMKERAAGILASVLEILWRGYGRDNRVKGKRDYVRLYRQKWKQCLAEEHGDTEAADENFEDSVNAGEVAGYYIAVYGDDALVCWKSNTQYKMLSEQDREVDRILAVLYGKDQGILKTSVEFPGIFRYNSIKEPGTDDSRKYRKAGRGGMDAEGMKDVKNTKDRDTAITYQNKDLVSKLFGDRMKGKSLSLLGLGTDLKVKDVRPTNIPVVQARELRMDNLFELEDGSVAVLDYESEYRKTNFTKYGRYVMDVADRYLKEGEEPDIRLMVLYTADIEKSETVFERTACSIRTEAAYLAGAPSREWMEHARGCIASGSVPDEVLMHLVLLPLTCKGEEKKQEAIRECVQLAMQIPDKSQESFVLAGILTFTDKIIDGKTRQYIKEVLGMTQIGRMLMDEGRQAGIQEGRQAGIQEGRQAGIQEEAQKNARNLLKRGTSLEEVAEILELPVETVQSWNLEACTVV